jgi:hypothetical protein
LSRTGVGLGREDIHGLLDDLSIELASLGARADLFLVGGAAIAIAYDAARATRDLDAVFLPTEVVRQAALAVAWQSIGSTTRSRASSLDLIPRPSVSTPATRSRSTSHHRGIYWR